MVAATAVAADSAAAMAAVLVALVGATAAAMVGAGGEEAAIAGGVAGAVADTAGVIPAMVMDWEWGWEWASDTASAMECTVGMADTADMVAMVTADTVAMAAMVMAGTVDTEDLDTVIRVQHWATATTPTGAGFGAGNGPAAYPTTNSNNGSASNGNLTALPTPPSVTQQPARTPNSVAQPYVDRGEAAFRTGNYVGAVQAMRHAVVDDPQNGLITLMLGQALFATGSFEEAAGATQAAMRQIPKEQWGVIIAHYEELYGQRKDYTDQLHALEKAIKGRPAEPALRFLLGFHYAYLGFVTESVDQLEAGLKLAPRDEMARQLRNDMRAKLAKPTKPPAPLAPAPSSLAPSTRAPLVPGLPAEPDDE